MSNPFSGLLTSGLKTLFNQAIEALLASDACGRPCRLYYGDTKWTDCQNCEFNELQGKSANIYTSGGPMPFENGRTCPYCQGLGRIAVEGTESVYLCVFWSY